MGIGERLKQLRTGAGMSERDLADRAGLSPDLLAELEKGQESDPRLSTLRALARALSVTLDALVQDVAEPQAGQEPSKQPVVPPGPPPGEELQAQAATPPRKKKAEAAPEMPAPQSKPHKRTTRRPRGS